MYPQWKRIREEEGGGISPHKIYFLKSEKNNFFTSFLNKTAEKNLTV